MTLRRIAPIALLFSVLLASAPLPPAATAGAASPPSTRYGAVEAYRAPDQARAAGLGWERIIFSWGAIQPNGPDDWHDSYLPAEILARSAADEREVVGLLIGTPAWASDGRRPVDVPRGLDRPPEDPQNLWAQFVRRIVASHQGRIRTWIVWNEPDIWDSSHSGYQWAGSVEEYYQLVKTAYLAAKSVDPAVQISLAGLTYWWDAAYGREPYLKRFLEVAASDPTAPAHAWYFDVVALQLYNDPLGLYEIPLQTRRLLAAHGLSKPIWISETNVAPWDDPATPLTRAHFRATLDEQASYLIEAAAAALAADTERFAVYKMKDDPGLGPGAEAYGLVRADGSARPAYAALRVITRYLDGARRATLRREGTVVEVLVERPGEQVVVAWNLGPAPAEVRIPAVAPHARLVDRLGQETAVVAGPDYRLMLPPATHNTAPGEPDRFLTGGGPLLLVQESTRPVREVLRAAPALVEVPDGTDAARRWAAPTGHSVSGEWLAFYEANGGLDSFGYPTSPVLGDTASGEALQCFQRGVLERTSGPNGGQIRRRLLGDLLYPGAEPPVDAADAPPGPYEYFPFSADRPTGLGHFVADYTRDGQPLYFKQFFDAHGGVAAFGYPKEEPVRRDGRWTQRFQAAVFEFHPEFDREGNLPGTTLPYRAFRVQLELLGDRYAAESGACGE